MRKVYFSFLVLIALSFLGCKSTTVATSSVEPNIKSVKISAHRGGPLNGFPENALETLENTAKNVEGVMMEIDVAQTSDSVLVLMHDKRLDRTTNLTGYLKDFSLQALKAGFLVNENKEPTHLKVPTLKEVFDWAKNENAYLSLDIKDKTIFHRVVDHIKQFEIVDKTEVIAYSIPDAEYIHDYDSQINLSVSVGSEAVLKRLVNSRVNTSNVSIFTGLTLKEKSFYEKIRNHGMVVTLGTMGNLDNRAKTRGFQLFNDWANLGIDRYATDYYLQVYNAISKQ